MGSTVNMDELLQQFVGKVKDIDAYVANADEICDTVKAGLDAADMALDVISKAPFCKDACESAKDVLQFVCGNADKAEDLIAAARRMVDVLKILSSVAKALDTREYEDETKDDIQEAVKEVCEMVKQVKDLVESFGEKGWLQKLFEVGKQTKTLAKLDQSIKEKLGTILDLQRQAEADKQAASAASNQAELMDKLEEILKERREYKLDKAVAKKKKEYAEGCSDEVLKEILSSDEFVQAAGLGAKAVQSELGLINEALGRLESKVDKLLTAKGQHDGYYIRLDVR